MSTGFNPNDSGINNELPSPSSSGPPIKSVSKSAFMYLLRYDTLKVIPPRLKRLMIRSTFGIILIVRSNILFKVIHPVFKNYYGPELGSTVSGFLRMQLATDVLNFY